MPHPAPEPVPASTPIPDHPVATISPMAPATPSVLVPPPDPGPELTPAMVRPTFGLSVPVLAPFFTMPTAQSVPPVTVAIPISTSTSAPALPVSLVSSSASVLAPSPVTTGFVSISSHPVAQEMALTQTFGPVLVGYHSSFNVTYRVTPDVHPWMLTQEQQWEYCRERSVPLPKL